MGKTRIIAETGAGQHGVATATVCALFGLPCEIYMGAVDVERQALNVFRMRLLGATVHPVHTGTATLKDAMNEALRDWVTNVRTTHYVIGSVAGPHPYPTLVRDLQAVIGREAREQIQEIEGRLPDACVACVGGGSNAMGLFHAFVPDRGVELYGVEAAGEGLDTGRHAATLTLGRVGVLHGARSYVLCDDDGQIAEAHSISAGLDYPGVGPEHSHFKETGRAQLPLGHRRGGARRLQAAGAHRGDPRGARELARDRGAAEDRAALARGGGGRAQSVGARRQGHGHDRQAAGGGAVNRIADCFARARAERRKVLVVYLTASDPDLETSRRAIQAAIDAGADIIELGVPWSDPSADGPVIQAAMLRALKARRRPAQRARGLPRAARRQRADAADPVRLREPDRRARRRTVRAAGA